MPSRSLSNSQACSNDIQAARRTSVSCPRGVTPAPSSPNCSSRGENSLPTLWAGPVAAFQLDRLSSVGLQEARLLPARHQHRCTSLTSGTALCWPCAPLSRLAPLHPLLAQLRSQLVYLRIHRFLNLAQRGLRVGRSPLGHPQHILQPGAHRLHLCASFSLVLLLVHALACQVPGNLDQGQAVISIAGCSDACELSRRISD